MQALYERAEIFAPDDADTLASFVPKLIWDTLPHPTLHIPHSTPYTLHPTPSTLDVGPRRGCTWLSRTQN